MNQVCHRRSPCGAVPLVAAEVLEPRALPSVAVSGLVFEDRNANEFRDAGEAGLAGWTVRVMDRSAGGAMIGSATTDADGYYSVTGLPVSPGGLIRVSVEPVIPAGWAPVALAGGHQFRDGDAGNVNIPVARGTIVSGSVYRDAFLDGTPGPFDYGLEGWRVFADTDGDGTPDPGERQVLSRFAGTFRLGPLGPGEYDIRAVPEPGFVAVSPPPRGIQLTVAEPRLLTGMHMGFADFGIVAGTAFDDADRDGTRDPGEAGVMFPTIFLDADGDGIHDETEASYHTGADGTYLLRLRPGSYSVGWVVPRGRVQTLPAGGGSRRVTVAAGGRLDGEDFGSAVAPAAVVARNVFYNSSSPDGNDTAANARDDAAIATDKVALLPGQTPSFANVTSYTRGINGVMVDLAGLPAGDLGGASPSWVSVKLGAGGDPSTWSAGPRPNLAAVRRGAGVGGFDRVTLVWNDFVIRNTWMQVTVLATPQTGLEQPDVFYVGNLVGETGDAAAAPFSVNALDLSAVKRGLKTDVPITGRLDFDRNGRVNALDLSATRSLLNRALTAPLFAVPPAAGIQILPTPGSVSDDDAGTSAPSPTVDVLG